MIGARSSVAKGGDAGDAGDAHIPWDVGAIGARNLLAAMRDAGAVVQAEAGKVMVNGASRLPPALLAEAKAARADLLAALRAEADAAVPVSSALEYKDTDRNKDGTAGASVSLPTPAAPPPAPAPEPDAGTDWQSFNAWAAPWGQHAPPPLPDQVPHAVPPGPLEGSRHRGPIAAGDWCHACHGRRWWRMDVRYPWVCSCCLPAPDPRSGIFFEGLLS